MKCRSCSSWSPKPSPAAASCPSRWNSARPAPRATRWSATAAPCKSIYKEIGRVASKPVNVLIRGETGTGKELIARAIYQHSDRANAPFIAINCAAIPETLLESELFGHERGAFTGAENRRIGRFEQADHGTIFLDEIGDMTPGTQVKLMRVLQESCLQRLGGKETIPVDVRVLAATHRDLESAIQQKQFREDLYYRLSVVVIHLPPLARSARRTFPELVKYFLRKYAAELGVSNPSIHAEAVEFLQAQTWPGNVRELENVVRKVLLLAQGYTINLDHVRAALTNASAPPTPPTNPCASTWTNCWPPPSAANSTTPTPASCPPPSGNSSAAPSSWPTATRPKPPAGWASPASPCARSCTSSASTRRRTIEGDELHYRPCAPQFQFGGYSL